MNALVSAVPRRPSLRGVSHQVAAFIAPGAGIALVLAALSPLAATAGAIYASSLTAMLTVSATYHRRHWPARALLWMRRLDHAMIFVLVAGTYTPLAVALDRRDAIVLMAVAWGGAAAGILRALLWPRSPKPITAAFYLVLGWAVVPFGPRLLAAVHPWVAVLLGAGGLLYTTGAAFYALKKPNLVPGVFGYHELFHAFVLGGAACHFAAVLGILRPSAMA